MRENHAFSLSLVIQKPAIFPISTHISAFGEEVSPNEFELKKINKKKQPLSV